jgi:hypothetical protein
VRIDASAPLANENAMTPTSIIREQKSLSIELVPEISPYPTVVIVVTVQYKETVYISFIVIASSTA